MTLARPTNGTKKGPLRTENNSARKRFDVGSYYSAKNGLSDPAFTRFHTTSARPTASEMCHVIVFPININGLAGAPMCACHNGGHGRMGMAASATPGDGA
jgi:hypothetical protein